MLNNKHSEVLKPVIIDLENDIAILPYSSGTPGLSKGVMLSHRNLVAHIILCETQVGATNPGAKDCLIMVLPLFHIFAISANMNLGLSNGASLVIVNGFKPKQFLGLIDQY